MYHGRARSSPPAILCPFQTTVYFFINLIDYTFLILKPQELWERIGLSQTANSELNVYMYLVKGFKRPCRGGGGSHVARLNFKTSRVSVYKCLSLIVGCRNLAEGGCPLSQFHFTRCRYFLGHGACRNLPWQGLF